MSSLSGTVRLISPENEIISLIKAWPTLTENHTYAITNEDKTC